VNDELQPQNKKIKSTMLKCGRRTYFFDINLASNNKKYLKITETQPVEEGQDRKRNTFLLFPEDLVQFQNKLSELLTDLH
jgi:hypothetical protein